MLRPGYEGLYFHGGGPNEVTYLLDGVDVTDPFFHSLGITLDKAIISQISLYPDWFPAEFGEATSEVVNIITKEEVDRYRGRIEYGSDGMLKDEANRLGYNRVRFILGGTLPTAFKSSFFLSGNLWKADNWSPGILPKPHNDKDQKNIFVKLTLSPLDNLKLTIGGSSARERFHLYDHPRSRGNWLKDGPLYEDGNSLAYFSLVHSLNHDISYSLKLGRFQTYENHSAQDGKSYNEWKAIGPGLDWVAYAIDQQWYNQEEQRWTGKTAQEAWIYYYQFVKGWIDSVKDGEIYWQNPYFERDAWRYRWYDTGTYDLLWEYTYDALTGEKTDSIAQVVYVPFDLDRYLQEVHEDPLHRSNLYRGDIDQLYRNYDEYAQFEYDFVPWWYRLKSTTYSAKFALAAKLANCNRLKVGLDYKGDYLKLTDIQFINANPYSDHYHKRPVSAAAYLQDQISCKDILIDAGLRFDYFDPASKHYVNMDSLKDWTYAKARHQISPRLGISFVVSDKMLLYANYGQFFEHVRLHDLYQALDADVTSGLPILGNPGLKPQKTVAYGIGLRYSFIPGLRGELSAYYKDVTDLEKIVEVNTSLSGYPVTYYRTTTGNIATTKGIDISLTRKASRYLSGSIGYSYLDARGTAPTNWERFYLYTGSTPPPVPLVKYPLWWDVTHSFKANLNLCLPKGYGPQLLGFQPLSDLNINLQFTRYTGAPYTPLDSKGNPGIPNSVRLPSTQQTDLKVIKGFKVAGRFYCGLFLDVRNLFNVENVVNVYPYSGKPDDNGYPPTLEGYGMNYERWQKAYEVWQRRWRDPAHYGPPRIVRMGLWLKI